MKRWIVFVMLAMVVLALLAAPTPGYTRGLGLVGPPLFWVEPSSVPPLPIPTTAILTATIPTLIPTTAILTPTPILPMHIPQPPVYAEPQQEYWYYCKDPQGYYPYIASCPGGWMRVLPTPPQPGREEGAVK